MKQTGLLIYYLMLTVFVNAQNKAFFTNINESELYMNPAAAGSGQATKINAVSRQQWVGYEGAPYTTILTGQFYADKLNSGYGFAVLNDKLGQENTLGCKLNYAYNITFTKTSSVAFGLGAGFINTWYNAQTLIFEEFDPDNTVNSFTAFMPDFNTGMYFRHNFLQGGISFAKTLNYSKNNYEIINPWYTNIHIQYVYPVTQGFELMPVSDLIVASGDYILNAGVIAGLNNKITTGIIYRVQESVNGILAYTFNNRLKVGYSYDFSTGKLTSYHSGSHEIFISFMFDKKEEEEPFHYKSPRNF